jgi:hypothetical protein
MTESLRRQVVVPPHVSAIYLVAGLGMVAAGVSLVVGARGAQVTPVVPDVPLAEITTPSPVAVPRAAIAASEAAAPIADEIKLMFRAGGASYIRLVDLGRDEAGALAGPRHGAPRLVREDGAEVAIAAVADADVPAIHRAWAGKQVIVDGGCLATVTGFAVVSRLIGDTMYAGLEKRAWDAAAVMHAGAPVLAARLDRCDGPFARDAALAPVVTPESIQNERLAAAARSAMIASSAGAETARRWEALGIGEAEGPWWDHAQLTTHVLRHPRTGAVHVAVHAHTDFECGGFDVNVWGLYRAAADGTLTPVHETKLDALRSVEQIIDIEGDGELELIGRSWFGDDVLLTAADGTEIDHLEMQFYGCPC